MMRTKLPKAAHAPQSGVEEGKEERRNNSGDAYSPLRACLESNNWIREQGTAVVVFRGSTVSIPRRAARLVAGADAVSEPRCAAV